MKNQKALLKEASDHGAVLFKGFDVRCAEEFASIMSKTGLREMQYIGGAAVRTLIVGNERRMVNPQEIMVLYQVFTSNESPPD